MMVLSSGGRSAPRKGDERPYVWSAEWARLLDARPIVTVRCRPIGSQNEKWAEGPERDYEAQFVPQTPGSGPFVAFFKPVPRLMS